MAFQFHGKEFTFKQPDGSPVKVRGWGDQHYAVFETLDGYTVTRNPTTGLFEIAAPASGTADLEPSGVSATASSASRPNVSLNLRAGRSIARSRGNQGFAALTGQRRCEKRRQQKVQMARAAMDPTGPLMAPPSRTTVGDYQGLCLLIDFSDDEATITQDEVDAFCNTSGYSGFGNNGSVFDYFRDTSLDEFRYQNTVTAYYRAAHPKSHYTDPTVTFGTRARQLITEALDNLKAQGFDFTQLTTDSGGYVYAMNVYYAGHCPNNWSEGLWPHAWSLAGEYDLGNSMVAFDYQFTDMGDELSLGTFCHENGHMVCDYPDLYDYGYESSGVGDFCLMCNGGDEKNPTHVSAYLKRLSGWASSVTPVSSGKRYSLEAGKNQFAMFAKNPTEYFIIENRHKSGRDVSLPDSGLTIWHVDELGSNNNEQMTPAKHYELSLEQADNQFELERKRGQSGDGQDLFDNATPNFSDQTGPNAKWWDGSASGLDINSISAAGTTMEFQFGQVSFPNSFEKFSSPNLSIPDAHPIGVSDVIEFDTDAVITSIRVSVDITHTYRGDLKVTLHAPTGQSILLHPARTGGGADNLVAQFEAADVPALGTLAGRNIKGEWHLQVQDLLSEDTGVLNRWGIEAEVDERVLLEESPGTRIPDLGQIERSMTATADGAVKEIEVAVDISHTYIKDLIVKIVAPGGKSVDLHRRAGGSADDINQVFTLATTADLNDLIGESAQGDWKLQISDNARRDIGKLNYWRLKLLVD